MTATEQQVREAVRQDEEVAVGRVLGFIATAHIEGGQRALREVLPLVPGLAARTVEELAKDLPVRWGRS